MGLTDSVGVGPWGIGTCMGARGQTAGPHSCTAGPEGSLEITWLLAADPGPLRASRAL